MIKTLDIESLSAIYERPTVKVVDTRPMSAFNGWRLDAEARGGHIPGAVAFPYSWAAGMYDADLVERMASKGLTPDQSIVLYGYGEEKSNSLAARMLDLGFDDAAVLAGGLHEWAGREDLEMARLPRNRQLVYPQWLHGLLGEEQIEEAPEGDLAVFHVNYGVPEEYERGHIPGAFHLDTNTLESASDWNRRSPEELEATLTRLGVTRDTTVIVYGRDTAADPAEQKPGRKAGQIAATRAAAILLYSGVSDVRLLDGGLNAWLAAGYPLETQMRTREATDGFGSRLPANPSFFIDFDEAEALIADPNGVLVSIRSKPENRGKTSGYNYIEELGDIPGAVWTNCGSDAYHMQHYRNVDNTMRDFNEVATVWSEVGITPEKRVAFYCGTGWRASETFFYAYLMEWPNVSVYDGGWFEWSRQNGSKT
jgi:thiosulfate/3-mercaptopyruvate sulfurtransferase